MNVVGLPQIIGTLEAFGIHGSMLQWFSSFCTTSRQQVVISGFSFE